MTAQTIPRLKPLYRSLVSTRLLLWSNTTQERANDPGMSGGGGQSRGRARGSHARLLPPLGLDLPGIGNDRTTAGGVPGLGPPEPRMLPPLCRSWCGFMTRVFLNFSRHTFEPSAVLDLGVTHPATTLRPVLIQRSRGAWPDEAPPTDLRERWQRQVDEEDHHGPMGGKRGLRCAHRRVGRR